MSHLLSHHSIKRAEETSFHWNINLLKIVCNITEQKKIQLFIYMYIPNYFFLTLFPLSVVLEEDAADDLTTLKCLGSTDWAFIAVSCSMFALILLSSP